MSEKYVEYERKYRLNEAELEKLPKELLHAPLANLEQFYIGYSSEEYQLRFRKDLTNQTTKATVKSGQPPERMEVETVVTDQTANYWAMLATNVLTKQRRQLKQADGSLSLDYFPEQDLWLVEAEGRALGSLAVGQEVTDDLSYQNHFLATILEKPDSCLPKVSGYNISQLGEFIHRIPDNHKEKNAPVIIGVAGQTASGKTTVARQIAQMLDGAVLSQDDYYIGLSRMKMQRRPGLVNFDLPSALDIRQLVVDLALLEKGIDLQHPTYDMSTGEPTGHMSRIAADIGYVIVEGIHALHPDLIPYYDGTLYVDAPMATRIGRRLKRDMAERPMMSPEENLRYMLEISEPSFLPYAAVQKSRANAVIHNVSAVPSADQMPDH